MKITRKTQNDKDMLITELDRWFPITGEINTALHKLTCTEIQALSTLINDFASDEYKRGKDSALEQGQDEYTTKG